MPLGCSATVVHVDHKMQWRQLYRYPEMESAAGSGLCTNTSNGGIYERGGDLFELPFSLYQSIRSGRPAPHGCPHIAQLWIRAFNRFVYDDESIYRRLHGRLLAREAPLCSISEAHDSKSTITVEYTHTVIPFGCRPKLQNQYCRFICRLSVPRERPESTPPRSFTPFFRVRPLNSAYGCSGIFGKTVNGVS